MKDPRDIIRRPIITENSTELMEEGKYTFEVDIRANKVEVKKAIEKIFDVKVEKVNSLRTPGKLKRYGRYSGMTAEKKKVVITLAEGSKPIEVFES